MREDFFLSRLVLWAVKKEILSMGGDQVNDFVLSKKMVTRSRLPHLKLYACILTA